jgi:hypothetical protein
MMHSRKAGLMPIGGEHIDAATREIEQVIGQRPRLYRPPWGWLTPWEGLRLRQRGYSVIGWDIYPDDWKLPEVPAEELVDFIWPKIQSGSIILFHDSVSNHYHWEKKETARAIRMLTSRLRDEGYAIVTVPEMLKHPSLWATTFGTRHNLLMQNVRVMGELPAITTIICTRNRGASAAETVQSILANDHPSFELIVVDQSTNSETADALQAVPV